MPFNELLKRQREAAGLTQEGLARAAGLTASAIAKLEQKKMDPSWSTVQRLARALGVSVLVFAEDEQVGSPGTDDSQTTAKKPARPRRKKP